MLIVTLHAMKEFIRVRLDDRKKEVVDIFIISTIWSREEESILFARSLSIIRIDVEHFNLENYLLNRCAQRVAILLKNLMLPMFYFARYFTSLSQHQHISIYSIHVL